MKNTFSHGLTCSITLVFLFVFDYSYALNVVFRFDDVRPYPSDLEWRVVRLFDDKHIPLSLAVIPCNQNEELECNIDSSYLHFVNDGSFEICLHGLTHQNFGDGEFGALDRKETQRRILQGKSILESTFGKDVTTFVPPYNIINKYTIPVLRDIGILVCSGSLFSASYEGDINYYVSSKHNVFCKESKWNEVLDVLKQNYYFDELYVIVFHHYDLKSDGDWDKLNNVLDYCNSNINIKTYTFSGLNSNGYSVSGKGVLLNQLVFPFRWIVYRSGTICSDDDVIYVFVVIFVLLLISFSICIKTIKILCKQ